MESIDLRANYVKFSDAKLTIVSCHVTGVCMATIQSQQTVNFSCGDISH